MEVVVTVAVLAILVAVALPSFKSTIRSNRLAMANNELLAAIGFARAEAMRNGFGTGICAANADATACLPGSFDLATNGWLIWGENDATGVDAYDSTDQVLRVSQTLPQISMQIDDGGGANGAVITFDSRGRPRINAARAISFQPSDCGNGEVGMARVVTVNGSGQSRSTKGDCETP